MPKREYSNLFNVAAFSSKYFSGKTSLPFKNLYLLIFPDDKSEILVFQSKLYWTLFCSIHVYNKFCINCNGLSDDKVVSFTKNEYGSLV